MKLYCTRGSPYARLTRIVVFEKDLADRVAFIWTRTRQPDDPMLAFNPSGRLPFLQFADGRGLENSATIVDYLDGLAPPRRFDRAEHHRDWTELALRATARAMLDGLAVWAREIARSPNQQSPTILGHERRRAARLADHFETRIDDHPLNGALNMAQLYLFVALKIEERLPDFDWRDGHPGLDAWYERIQAMPSVRAAR